MTVGVATLQSVPEGQVVGLQEGQFSPLPHGYGSC